MYRLGMWAAWALENLRRIKLPGHRIAAAMGFSAALILLSGVIEVVATAIFYASLAVAVGYIGFKWVRKWGAQREQDDRGIRLHGVGSERE